MKQKPKVKVKAKVRNPGSPWRDFAPKREKPEPLPVMASSEVVRAVRFAEAERRELGDG